MQAGPRILITGAAGMIGRKLTAALAADGLGGRPVAALHLVDVVRPEPPESFAGEVAATVADLSDEGVAEALLSGRPDIVFHLAAIVSGEAEADFDKGYRINLDGTRALFEAARRQGGDYRPRIVFSSSIAVFGTPFPEVIPDDYVLSPRTSYGVQKAAGELLLSDYSRRGFIDGVALRLPTVCIRPGRPNLAASGFFSGILREPLNGQRAVLPVSPDVRHWFASPRSAVGFLLHAATLPAERLDKRRCLTMPGFSATVAEQIEALGRVAGADAVALIDHVPDPDIARIVDSWPRAFETPRAVALGFRAETDMDEIVQVYIEDELEGARRS
ncbi:D-erythronate dehydrogenase [Wenxinia marina]|uniref:Nucleoside-diphosphate-sugar epimerase n=1 Tax=Wenxinia marina DSM 24838 TaxID=1123501 RepID=A0A0D0Q8N7_9RHOB|nr:D-erythronate dehydrogenase [Wenxinia marina]KIQ67483.1 Nucleoside-diphosphate-sugar epimerase [Wenxinia marina DSM 24838]GGL69171.1 NAD-dependent epimerase [Wenxinia marina]